MLSIERPKGPEPLEGLGVAVMQIELDENILDKRYD
jgi:hypothetical protein